jgi:hypothetical protein
VREGGKEMSFSIFKAGITVSPSLPPSLPPYLSNVPTPRLVSPCSHFARSREREGQSEGRQWGTVCSVKGGREGGCGDELRDVGEKGRGKARVGSGGLFAL